MRQQKINQIIYDPLSWIYPGRFKLDVVLDTVRCRSVINDILINHFMLPLSGVNVHHNLEALFIQYWHVLPQAALRIACLRQRSLLAVCGNIIHLDAGVRQFARLDLIASSAPVDSVFSQEALWHQAFKELWLYKNNLSAVLVKRLPLLFCESVVSEPDLQETTQPDSLLLRLAIQHAK